MKETLQKVIAQQNLSSIEAEETLLMIGSGEINATQIAAFLTAIQTKGITVDELSGFRNAMLSLAININLDDFDAIDVCGTGGDGKDTFNISTTAAFVVAGAGQNVAKHGNHGVSSAIGSSTILEYLDIKFTNDADFLLKKIETAGICYLHAPLFHPGMKYVGPVRKDLGIKTFFNILGPLLNPANVKNQLSGVSDLATFELYKSLFEKTDVKFGIVHSLDVYDEISLTSNFKLATRTTSEIISPKTWGFETIFQHQLSGGLTLEDSAKIMTSVLENKATNAQTNAVLANAGLALSIARDISFLEGIDQAKESIKSGNAFKSFKKLIS